MIFKPVCRLLEIKKMEPIITFNELNQFIESRLAYSCEVQGDLVLYHYKSCSDDDSDKLKQIRGIVFDLQGNLVMRGFPFSKEIVKSFDDETVKFIQTLIDDKYSFLNSYEGTILRVFFHKDKWFVSTHKRLNADESRWAGQLSFGQQFRDALRKLHLEEEMFFQGLDKTKQYMFLLTPTEETRIVACAPSPLYHVGTFVDFHLKIDENVAGVPQPEYLNFADPKDLLLYVSMTDFRKLQGVIAVHEEKGFVKIVSEPYEEFAKLRGNKSNILLRYLELRKAVYDARDEDSHTRAVIEYQKFQFLYFDKQMMFHALESKINNIIRLIHSAYIKRYVKREFAIVPQEMYHILKACHSLFVEKLASKITVQIVFNLINAESVESLWRMLNIV